MSSLFLEDPGEEFQRGYFPSDAPEGDGKDPRTSDLFTIRSQTFDIDDRVLDDYRCGQSKNRGETGRGPLDVLPRGLTGPRVGPSSPFSVRKPRVGTGGGKVKSEGTQVNKRLRINL